MALSQRLIRRGDIFLTQFGSAMEGEAAYIHPAVIVTNNIANANAHVLAVVPITSNTERIYAYDLELPTRRSGLNLDSKIQINLIRHVNIGRFRNKLGFIPDDLMQELDSKLVQHLGLRHYLEIRG